MSFMLASDTTSTAAAPSLIPEELPAVIVPSCWKAGLSLASDSAVVSGRGCSSVAQMLSAPFRSLIATGTISAWNLPSAMALPAFCCEAAAKASCSARGMPYFSAIFSAVAAMWQS